MCQKMENEDKLSWSVSSGKLVGVAGFEPTTPTTPK